MPQNRGMLELRSGKVWVDEGRTLVLVMFHQQNILGQPDPSTAKLYCLHLRKTSNTGNSVLLKPTRVVGDMTHPDWLLTISPDDATGQAGHKEWKNTPAHTQTIC